MRVTWRTRFDYSSSMASLAKSTTFLARKSPTKRWHPWLLRRSVKTSSQRKNLRIARDLDGISTTESAATNCAGSDGNLRKISERCSEKWSKAMTPEQIADKASVWKAVAENQPDFTHDHDAADNYHAVREIVLGGSLTWARAHSYFLPWRNT